MDRVVQMSALGSRTELVQDLGYQLTFSVFDEASVAEWRGRDLRLANEIPKIDLIVVFVRKVFVVLLVYLSTVPENKS